MENKEAKTNKSFVFKENSLVNLKSRVLKFQKGKISNNMMEIPRKQEQELAGT